MSGQSLHLPVTFASMFSLPVELLDDGHQEVKLAMPAHGADTYQVILHATRAAVARLLWPEPAALDHA